MSEQCNCDECISQEELNQWKKESEKWKALAGEMFEAIQCMKGWARDEKALGWIHELIVKAREAGL